MPPLAPKINRDSPFFKPSVVSRPARAVTASTAMAAACGMVSFPGMSARLRRTIEHAQNDYDYILLDAQAGSDHYAAVAMSKRVSDVVVLVAEYDPMSAAGIERLKGL